MKPNRTVVIGPYFTDHYCNVTNLFGLQKGLRILGKEENGEVVYSLFDTNNTVLYQTSDKEYMNMEFVARMHRL